MNDEPIALQRTHTWTLVPPHSAQNLVGSKWVYRINQLEGIDYTKTFNPVAKSITIRILLSIAVQNDWHISQLDVTNAFLHGHLTEEGNNPSYCTQLISQLGSQFAIKDLGPLHYFLGIEVHRTASGLFLSQIKYTIDLLSKTDMLDAKPFPSPATTAKLALDSGELLSNPTSYRSIHCWRSSILNLDPP
ncbi:unnamed protein product [Prunus brigantina]